MWSCALLALLCTLTCASAITPCEAAWQRGCRSRFGYVNETFGGLYFTAGVDAAGSLADPLAYYFSTTCIRIVPGGSVGIKIERPAQPPICTYFNPNITLYFELSANDFVNTPNASCVRYGEGKVSVQYPTEGLYFLWMDSATDQGALYPYDTI